MELGKKQLREEKYTVTLRVLVISILIVVVTLFPTMASASGPPPYSITFTETGLPSGTSWTTTFTLGANNIIQTLGFSGNGAYWTAYDSGTNNIYVVNDNSNTVTLVSGSSYSTVGTVNVGSTPLGIAYDSTNGYIYVSNSASNTVTVISGTTVEGTVTVGTYPEGVAFDPNNGYIYVANTNSNTVTVISGTSVVNSGVSVGSGPVGVCYDSSNQDIYVGDANGGEVSVISGTSVVATITGISYPEGLAFDSSTGDIYVASNSGNDIVIISGSSNSIVGTITHLASNSVPYGVAYNPSNNYVYVVNDGTPQNVMVISGTTIIQNVTPLSGYSNPFGICYDSSSNTMWVGYDGSSQVAVISGSSTSTPSSSTSNTITFSESNSTSDSYTVTSPISGGTGIQYVASPSSGGITVSGSSQTISITFTTQYYLTTSTSPSGGGSMTPSSSWYNSGSQVTLQATANSNFEFSSWSGSGSGSYSGSSNPVTITMNGPVSETANFVELYGVTVTESGLPTGTEWYFNISTTSQKFSSSSPSISFNEPNGTYSYSIATGNSNYVPTSSSGTFTVSGSSISVPVTFRLNSYNVTFTETGLPSGTQWYLNISGGSSYPTTASSITFRESNGQYSFTVASGNKEYAPSPSSGTFTINNATYSGSITFSLVTYSVTMTESGLPTGTKWYLNVSGQSSLSSTSGSISLNLPNGTYSYTVATGNKIYTPSPSSGSLTVNGAALSETISFSEVTYAIIFTESGLSSGTWYVNISTTSQSFSEPYTTHSISFSEPNGTYSFTVTTDYKTDSPSPSSGSFTVNGASVSESISFSVVTYSITFTETGLPTGTKWYVNITGQSSLNSTGTSISTTLANGSYTYSIGTPDKIYSAQGGSFMVNGGTVSETVTFNLVTYSVTFTESGLPSGTKWYLNISGQSSLVSTSASISISLVNNSYSYTVATGNKIYNPSPSSGTFTVNGAAVSETITFNEVTYAITFTESGLPSSTKWFVNITSGSSYSSTASSITLPEPNGSYTYSIATGDKQYSPSPFSGGFTVNGSPVSESVTFSLVTFEVTYTESGLPAGTKWYLNISGQSSLSSTGTSVSTYEPNGTYSFTIATDNKIYNPNPSSGSFTVNGAAVSGTESFSEVIYLVTFKETGLPSGVTWYINVTGGGSYSSATTSLSFHDPNGTYSFTATDNDNKYRASSYTGSFTVYGASLNVSVSYVSVTYNVTFSESGLPSKSTWYVILNGSRESSNTSSITFLEFNGSLFLIDSDTFGQEDQGAVQGDRRPPSEAETGP